MDTKLDNLLLFIRQEEENGLKKIKTQSNYWDLIRAHRNIKTNGFYVTFLNDTVKTLKKLGFNVEPYEVVNFKITI